MALLGRIFADAQEDNYVRTSPMPTRPRKSDRGGKSARRGRALTPDQAQRLLAETEGDDDLRLVILIALLAGLRRGEIFALDWPVRWEDDVLHVSKSLTWCYGKHYERPDDQRTKAVLDTPKTACSVRDIDVSPELKKELRTRFMKAKDEKGLIFKSRERTPLDPGNVVSRWFIPAVEWAIEKATEEKEMRLSRR